MGYITARLTDGRIMEFEDRPLNSGGEKVVFRSRDRAHVVGFFFGRLADRVERLDRIQRIINRYNPTTGSQGSFWQSYYCWPTGVVDGLSGVPPRFAADHSLVQPALGVVAPAYRAQFFFHDRFGNRQEKEVKWFTGRKAASFVPESELGTLLTRLQICTKLARAVRRMHFAGLAHSDLSNKNVLIDPKGGDTCVIDIDSLVVPGLAPPTVLGTPGYIAPEVMTGRAKPSIETDKHALAVLIYQILLNRHPLHGRKVRSGRSAEEDEALSMGRDALFVEHTTDRSNPPAYPIRVPMGRLGPYLAPLFVKSFVTGLHHPQRRADAAEWELALYRTLNMIHPTPSRRDWFIVGPDLPLQCPFTGERIALPVPVAHLQRVTHEAAVDEKQVLVLFHNLILHTWHLRPHVTPDERADRTPMGYVSLHGGGWWVVNLSDETWHPSRGAPVRKNEALELKAGLDVRFGDGDTTRGWRIEYLPVAVR